MNIQPGLLAKKLGMTQIFLDDGTRVPVTVLSVKGNTVTAHRTEERDGYTALQVGFEEQKPSRMTKADLGRFKQAEVSPRRHVREFRVDADVLAKCPVGQDLPLDLFEEGTIVDVSGTSKGKGFQGVIKRHGFGGGRATHGSMFHRAPGSIGQASDPSRVFPGTRLPGRTGGKRITGKNLKIVKVDAENNLLYVKGSVPGPNNGYVAIRRAKRG